ncbi:MAG: ribosome small subunit-dependent GTPase A [Gemmatimonadaceae bacterium]|nr:ribosome small subunit-dependent GTPase A [Gemmatimonadaceae bacterium]
MTHGVTAVTMPMPAGEIVVDGVVVQGTGGVWEVLTDSGARVVASLRGRLKQEGDDVIKLAVGDRVTMSVDPNETVGCTITRIHTRRSKLARRAPGGARGERVVVANLDQGLIVFAATRPDPHPRMLDRFLVIAEANDIAARIVVNKCDLVEPEFARSLFADQEAAGYPVHFTSVESGEGLDELRAQLEGRSSALSGPSGVGKSSLMNRLFPGLDLRTAAISDSVNKGRHTTVGAVLHPLPAHGFIADTPGLREVGLWGIDARHVAECFPEMRALLGECRFADCTHLVEPGCAVREAVDGGTISASRYESYAKLYLELKNWKY